MRRLRWLLALWLVLVVAFALRVFHIQFQSLWYDEAFSVYLAHMSLADITARTAADIQPPLYYYLLHFWVVLAGESEFALRFLSLCFGVLTVPLIYVMAQRLFGRAAALMTAFLAALSPLYLWYSQEARMYTQITFLLLLSSYLLLRATRPTHGAETPHGAEEPHGAETPHGAEATVLKGSAPSRGLAGFQPAWFSRMVALAPRGTWLFFALVNIAAVYTHYFAFAVIAFQLLHALGSKFQVSGFRFQVPRSKPKSGTGNLKPETWNLKLVFASFAAILLAYVPWMPFMVTRLGQDVSYWQGALKLDEAVRHIFINFATGESVLEAQAQWIAVGWLIVLFVGLAALVVENSKFKIQDSNSARNHSITDSPNHPITQSPDHAVTFLILYLVIPLALLLFLFYRSPKFNARYLMIASPAFLLLAGAALASLFSLARRGQFVARVVSGALFFLTFAFLFLTCAFADYNAFSDPAFTKADFRGVARYIQDHLAPDEAIILTSGHLFPAFDYYFRGDAPEVRLPDDPTLNTEHVLGYDTASVLNGTVAGKRGVWVVLWQDEVVDPNGFVPFLLSSRGKEEKVAASFYQVRLRHWVLPTNAHFAPEPEPVVARPANLANKVKLLGYDSPNPTAADVGLSLNLYWQALDNLEGDYQVALRVLDAAGNLWGKQDRRPAGYNYPTTRWKKGENLFGAYTVPLLPGTPAGNYFVEVNFYTASNPSGLDVLAASGAPVGKTVKVGPIPVLPAVAPASYASLSIQKSVSQPLGPFTLLGYQLGRDKASAGERVPLTLFWRADAAPSKDYAFQPMFGDVAGESLPLANAEFPTSKWRAGEIVRGQYSISVPVSVQAGSMPLGLRLSDGTKLSDLASFTVEKTDRVFVAPSVQFVQSANFGNAIALTGYNLSQTTVKPGETLQVTLVWQARDKMDKAYTVFVHLLDQENKPVAQKDAEPMGGARATTGWVADEYLADTYELPIKSETPPGKYTIEIGWYDAKDPAFVRLPVLDASGAPAGDHVILKTAITVGQ